MDPNANLREQEQLLGLRAYYLHFPSRRLARDRERLRELRAALAFWLARGGFPPDWTKAPKASSYYTARTRARGNQC